MLLKIQNIIPPTHLFADNSRWRIRFFVGVDVPSLHKTFDAKQFLWYFIDRKWCTPNQRNLRELITFLFMFNACQAVFLILHVIFTLKMCNNRFSAFFSCELNGLERRKCLFLHKIGDYGRNDYIMKRLLPLNFTHNWCLSITIYEHSIKYIRKSFNFEDNAKCWMKTIPFRNVQLGWMDQCVGFVWQFDDNLKQLTMHQPPISEQWMYSYKIRSHSVNWHSHLAFAC